MLTDLGSKLHKIILPEISKAYDEKSGWDLGVFLLLCQHLSFEKKSSSIHPKMVQSFIEISQEDNYKLLRVTEQSYHHQKDNQYKLTNITLQPTRQNHLYSIVLMSYKEYPFFDFKVVVSKYCMHTSKAQFVFQLLFAKQNFFLFREKYADFFATLSGDERSHTLTLVNRPESFIRYIGKFSEISEGVILNKKEYFIYYETIDVNNFDNSNSGILGSFNFS